MSSQKPAELSPENSRWLRVSKDASDPFPITNWTMVRRVSSGHAGEAENALNKLCSIYWYPIYAYVRRSFRSPQDAEDLTQTYIARLFERNYIGRAHQEKGKFRAFLLADLKLFLSNETARSRALKRGGGRVIESFDQALAEQRYSVEPTDHDTPDKLFDRAWATTLLAHVRDRLRGHYAAKGQEKFHEVLQPFVAWHGSDQSYANAADALGKTVNDIKVGVYRMRRRYRAILEDEIANTVSSRDEIGEEIGALATLFSRPSFTP